MNYNQFYKKKDQLKRGRNAEEKANLARVARVFFVFLCAGAALGAVVVLIAHFAAR